MKRFSQNYAISSGFLDIVRCYFKYTYYRDVKKDVPDDVMPYSDFLYFLEKYPHLTLLCSKLLASKRGKVHRVKTRLNSMLYDNNGILKDTLFLTLTFTDDVLSSTSQKTRRTYVARFLKSHGLDYVANIDFGEKNGREHYHCVFGSNFIDPNSWSYGSIDFIHITKTPNKIAQYINKLTFHSVKDTTGFLIYSRKRKVN